MTALDRINAILSGSREPDSPRQAYLIGKITYDEYIKKLKEQEVTSDD